MKLFRLIIFFIVIFLVNSSHAQPRRYCFNFDDRVISYSEQLVSAEMGLREGKSNRGKHIRKYGKSVFGNEKDGFYYCLAGQYWAIDSASKYFSMNNLLMKTGHCNTLFNYAIKHGKRDYNVDFSEGDLLIWKYRNSASGHTERIKSFKNKRLLIVYTYAFNTQIKGEGTARNGGGNAIKVRHLKHPLGRMFLRGSIGLKQKGE